MQQDQKRAAGASNSPNEAQVDPYLTTRPKKYRHLVLPYNWYIVGMNKVKRMKYKNHGVITFKALNKLVAERWEKVDNKTRQFRERIADDERDRYTREVDEYVLRYGREALMLKRQPTPSGRRRGVLNIRQLNI